MQDVLEVTITYPQDSHLSYHRHAPGVTQDGLEVVPSDPMSSVDMLTLPVTRESCLSAEYFACACSVCIEEPHKLYR